jgi:hypothetical protein
VSVRLRSLSRASARLTTPLFGLAPCGVLPATRVATGAVRSYRTFSPLPLGSPLRGSPSRAGQAGWAGKAGWARTNRFLLSCLSCLSCPSRLLKTSPEGASRKAVCFLCHCPSSRPDRELPGALPCGVRTFLGVRRRRTTRSSGSLRSRRLYTGRPESPARRTTQSRRRQGRLPRAPLEKANRQSSRRFPARSGTARVSCTGCCAVCR